VSSSTFNFPPTGDLANLSLPLIGYCGIVAGASVGGYRLRFAELAPTRA
jgi:hypothetical protein